MSLQAGGSRELWRRRENLCAAVVSPGHASSAKPACEPRGIVLLGGRLREPPWAPLPRMTAASPGPSQVRRGFPCFRPPREPDTLRPGASPHAATDGAARRPRRRGLRGGARMPRRRRQRATARVQRAAQARRAGGRRIPPGSAVRTAKARAGECRGCDTGTARGRGAGAGSR